MESATVEKSEKSEVNFNKPESISNLKYEIVLNELFKRLNIKANQSQLIRAFLIISKGEKHFEVSYLELADILFQKDSASIETLKKRVADWLKVLLNWQETNGIELIRVLERGHQIPTESGRFDYHKTKYEFVMLDEFQNLLSLYSDSETNLNDELEILIASIKKQYQPIEKMKKYHPRHQIRRNKRNILTKFKRSFELLIEAGENPVEYCQKTLNEVCKMLNEMEEKWTEQCTRENIMSNFEGLIDENKNIAEGEDLGLKF